MRRTATVLLAFVLTSPVAHAQRVEVCVGLDDRIEIRLEGTVAMSGLNLKSAGGYLIPIPPGTTAAPAAPFTFLLANNANHVSYAAIPGSTVDVSDLLIPDVGYTGDSSGATEDMAGSAYGNADFQQVRLRRFYCLPEPAANTLAVTACLGLLGLRRRRHNAPGVIPPTAK